MKAVIIRSKSSDTMFIAKSIAATAATFRGTFRAADVAELINEATRSSFPLTWKQVERELSEIARYAAENSLSREYKMFAGLEKIDTGIYHR